MNTKTDSVRSTPTRRRWLFWGVLLPIILLFAAITSQGIRQWQAANRFEAEIAQIRASNLPIDNASMARWFREMTRTEGASAWGEVLLALETAIAPIDNPERMPFVGTGDPIAVPDPDRQWPEEKQVGEYLRWIGPTIEKIHQAVELPKPVWLPIEFRGFQTLLAELQSSRSVTRHLQLEVEHALYQKESERALRGITSLRGVADAFDWQICLVGDLVHRTHAIAYLATIRRSMAYGLWGEAEIDRIDSQLAPRDPFQITERWRRVFIGERAMLLSSLNDAAMTDYNADEFGAAAMKVAGLPTVKVGLLEKYFLMLRIADGPLAGLPDRANELELWLTQKGSAFDLTTRWTSMWLPAIRAYSQSIIREEDDRRVTRTSLAVKKYQIREGNWPQDLAALDGIGLPASERVTVGGKPLGYQVDGDAAWVWGPDTSSRAAWPEVLPERPDPADESTRDHSPWAMIR
jgi:hypothetical protein